MVMTDWTNSDNIINALRSRNSSYVIFLNVATLDLYACGRFRAYEIEFSASRSPRRAVRFDPLKLFTYASVSYRYFLAIDKVNGAHRIPSIIEFIRGRHKSFRFTHFHVFRTDRYFELILYLELENKTVKMYDELVSWKPNYGRAVPVTAPLTCLSPYSLIKPSLTNVFNIFTPGVWILILIFLSILLLIIHLASKTSLSHLFFSILVHFLSTDTFASIPSRSRWSVTVSKISTLLLIDIFFFTILKNDLVSVMTTPGKMSAFRDEKETVIFKQMTMEYAYVMTKNLTSHLTTRALCTDVPQRVREGTIYDLENVGEAFSLKFFKQGSTLEYYKALQPLHEAGFFDVLLKTNIENAVQFLHPKESANYNSNSECQYSELDANWTQSATLNHSFIKQTDHWIDYQSHLIYDSLKLHLQFQAFAVLYFFVELEMVKLFRDRKASRSRPRKSVLGSDGTEELKSRREGWEHQNRITGRANEEMGLRRAIIIHNLS